jgi:hypothetical protein
MAIKLHVFFSIVKSSQEGGKISQPRKFGLRLFLKNSKKKKFSLYERQPGENSQGKLIEGQLAVAKSRQTLQNKNNVFYFPKENGNLKHCSTPFLVKTVLERYQQKNRLAQQPATKTNRSLEGIITL